MGCSEYDHGVCAEWDETFPTCSSAYVSQDHLWKMDLCLDFEKENEPLVHTSQNWLAACLWSAYHLQEVKKDWEKCKWFYSILRTFHPPMTVNLSLMSSKKIITLHLAPGVLLTTLHQNQHVCKCWVAMKDPSGCTWLKKSRVPLHHHQKR